MPYVDPAEFAIAEELKSRAINFADLTDEERKVFLDSLPEDYQQVMQYTWEFWARKNQLEPEDGDWRTWLILAGRGWGKTRAGAEWVNKMARSGKYKRMHLVGATASDIRDIMVEGPSGIIDTSPPWFRAQYRPTKRRVEWPNGAWALAFSADEPERLRGEQCEAAWCDELAAWRYPEAWTQLMLGLRLGTNPRVVVTTTPRPTRLIKKLHAAESTHVTHGITFENFDNLAAAFTEEIVTQYEGLRKGRQELYAEILADAEGALWKTPDIEEMRVEKADVPEMNRTVVAVDPAMTFGESASETGIMVCGKDYQDHGYVLQDASGKLRPDEWARKVIALYHQWDADKVVAEKNQGGELVRHTLQVYDNTVPIKLVHASKNKQTRAEPVAGVYEQGKIHHVGAFPELESQMVEWEPGMTSPDRLDALVWGFTELFIGANITRFAKMRTEADLQSSGSYWKRF